MLNVALNHEWQLASGRFAQALGVLRYLDNTNNEVS